MKDSSSCRSPLETTIPQRYNDYTPNYLTSMSTTSGLGGSNSYTTSGLSASSLLSSHPNISSCRKYSSSGSEEDNMHSLATYQQHQHHHRTPRGFEPDMYSNGGFERRSASNTPEFSRSRSPYNSRVPQMGVSAGHRRTLSNYSGYSQVMVQPHIVEREPPITSKNPFLNSPVHNRHLYSERIIPTRGESTLRSSLKKKAAIAPDQEREGDHSFSSSSSKVHFSPDYSCTPGTTTDGKSFSSS